MQVRGFGIRADLPRGWEAALRTAAPAPPAPDEAATLSAPTAPVLHAGTFPLPTDRGDFGSGAVETMQDGDTFVALLEYDQEEADTPLFEAQGLPRRLDPRRFHRRSLQRVLPGQAGYQTFFTEGGRAFCLYVVLGDEEDKLVQVRRAEQMLATIVIDPLPGAAASSTTDAPETGAPETGEPTTDEPTTTDDPQPVVEPDDDDEVATEDAADDEVDQERPTGTDDVDRGGRP
ncbi:hypothetical protein [Nitriliruptor alkaliphilus]|uniref:hypothetical protein n=1 Tax=Nitriliruptor alkaliphilus TaxID=427918 RepID=UPI000696BB0E|nr:hypothetical protein [Nitriliruptor alkaliphilus]